MVYGLEYLQQELLIRELLHRISYVCCQYGTCHLYVMCLTQLLMQGCFILSIMCFSNHGFYYIKKSPGLTTVVVTSRLHSFPDVLIAESIKAHSVMHVNCSLSVTTCTCVNQPSKINYHAQNIYAIKTHSNMLFFNSDSSQFCLKVTKY